MPDSSPDKAGRKASARSRVTNGSVLLPGVDGRSRWARRLRDLMSLYADDLGGDAALTEMQRSLVRRAATLTVELERAEEGFAMAGAADANSLGAYQTTANSLRRILETLGLSKHTPRTVRAMPTIIDGVFLSARNGGGAAEQTPDRREQLDLARRIAAVISDAVANGTPVPPSIAAIASDLDLADIVETADREGV